MSYRNKFYHLIELKCPRDIFRKKIVYDNHFRTFMVPSSEKSEEFLFQSEYCHLTFWHNMLEVVSGFGFIGYFLKMNKIKLFLR